jgi:precorrin-6B C5,15-methyltransferase / cobalt-precorrin-6B C5,C15-methyltransferase
VRPVTVVGIGADGWTGLPPASRDALTAAGVVLGGPRQLDLLPPSITAERVPWPSPLLPALPGLVDEHRDRGLVVLASGDPMWFGIGSSLAAFVDDLRVLPHPSSISLACARLGWPVDSVEVVSAVGRPLAAVHPSVLPGRRVLVLVSTSTGAADVAALLRARGYAASRVVALSQLGGPGERAVEASAEGWTEAHDALAIVAVECVADAGTTPLPRTPGLPDEAFEHDGQITKREVRAITLAALAPVPGRLLWDVGAGSGSVAIEWLRVHPSCRAIAVEPRADRRERIERNALALGVPALHVVAGRAPEALDGLPAPDAIFVGGGVSVPGVLHACVSALRPGGRLVANGVTVETETALADQHAKLGGSLLRIALERAEPIGGFTGWTPARTVTQWSYP